MLNTNVQAHNFFDLEASINSAQFYHSMSERLTKILIKNYLDDVEPKDKPECLMFALQREDIITLVWAINEFNNINTPIIDKIYTDYEKICEEVLGNE